MAAMAEGDATFAPSEEMPSRFEIQREAEELRDSFSSLPRMVRWRLALRPVPARAWAVIASLRELLYFDSFPVLSAIETGLSLTATAMQDALAHQNRLSGPVSVMNTTDDSILDSSQRAALEHLALQRLRHQRLLAEVVEIIRWMAGLSCNASFPCRLCDSRARIGFQRSSK